MDYSNVKIRIDRHIDMIAKLKNQANLIEQVGEQAAKTLVAGHTIFLCGNGGSASDSSHLAAELVGRFSGERKGLPAISLTGNSSILTSISNDYGYNEIFSRQIEALAKANDMLIAISTSGSSTNVLNAIKCANSLGAFTVGFTGIDGAEIRRLANITFMVPERETAIIQEAHILVGHIMCELIEAKLFQKQNEHQPSL